MPETGSWRLKKLWIRQLGLRQRGMSPDMKRGWSFWRPILSEGVTPQKYPRIFIIKIIIYSGYN